MRIDMNIKARMQRADAAILLAHDMAVYPGRVKQIEACNDSAGDVKAQFLAYSDTAVRIARIKMLKAQVEAGTYIVNSRALAQKMQSLPVICALSEGKENDSTGSVPIPQGDEPHE
jgi:hypothetical protein